jgi:hypothetical protein
MRALIFVPIGVGVLLIGAPYTIWFFWPGRGYLPDETSARINPRIVNRGLVRQAHVVLLTFGCLLLFVGLSPGSGLSEPSIFRACGFGLAAFSCVCGCQFLFNHPKWIVPPRYRDEPGFALDAWTSVRKRVRRRESV